MCDLSLFHHHHHHDHIESRTMQYYGKREKVRFVGWSDRRNGGRKKPEIRMNLSLICRSCRKGQRIELLNRNKSISSFFSCILTYLPFFLRCAFSFTRTRRKKPSSTNQPSSHTNTNTKAWVTWVNFHLQLDSITVNLTLKEDKFAKVF